MLKTFNSPIKSRMSPIPQATTPTSTSANVVLPKSNSENEKPSPFKKISLPAESSQEKPNPIKKISLQEGLGSVSKVLESMKLTDAVKGYKYVNGKFSVGGKNKKDHVEIKDKDISGDKSSFKPDKPDIIAEKSKEVIKANKAIIANVKQGNSKLNKRLAAESDQDAPDGPPQGFITDKGVEYALECAPKINCKIIITPEKETRSFLGVETSKSMEDTLEKELEHNDVKERGESDKKIDALTQSFNQISQNYLSDLQEDNSRPESLNIKYAGRSIEARKIQLAEAHSRVFDAFSRAFNRQNVQFEKGKLRLQAITMLKLTFKFSSN